MNLEKVKLKKNNLNTSLKYNKPVPRFTVDYLKIYVYIHGYMLTQKY